MTDGELLCNYKKCRKVLTGTAYITRCSHAFCEEDGMKQIESQHFEKKCPACQSPLVKSYDLVKVTLNPNDQFKSMVLAGLRPEVVMDIATRAIMFWSYQQHQEQLQQFLITKSLRDVIAQRKSESEVEIGFLKSEILTLKRKLEDLEKESEKQNQKCGELSEKLALKIREIQKWQMLCESMKRKQLTSMVMQHDSNPIEPNPIALNVGPQTIDDFLLNRPKPYKNENFRTVAKNYAEELFGARQKKPLKDDEGEFVFQPRALNTYVSPKLFIENGKNYRNQALRKYQN